MSVIPMPPLVALSIVAIGVVYAVFSVFLQRKLVDPKRMREIQYKVSQLSKELNALIKNNATKEEISKKQGELMPLMSENMKKQFKPMIIILPIFLFVYYVLLGALYSGVANDTVEFIIPLHYRGLFFATVLILGFVLSIVILVYDRIKAKEEQKQSAQSVGQPIQPQEINK
ncbi:MAG: EMC3/TMCO1 family protein [Candidatus Micrarchaeaceae archaeon]